MIPLLVLRPEPGNSATVERARALGLEALGRPLFTVEPVAWAAPDPARFDYLLLTSANAVRWGERQLADLRALPVLAVGPVTAAAAQAAGLTVVLTGDGGVEELLAAVPDEKRIIHLAGADHHRPAGHRVIETRVTYRTRPLVPDIPDGKLVALIHSARAGARFANLARDRADIKIAAISPAAAAACGSGWASVNVAHTPDDAALLALAARLCQD